MSGLTPGTRETVPNAPVKARDSVAIRQRGQDMRDENQHEMGRKIYNFRCYFCHGYSGNAKTLAASFLNPAPRDFTRTSPESLSRERMIEVVRAGKKGTAMKGFANALSDSDIALVVGFVRDEFMRKQAPNTTYHTAENGWPEHDRYKTAFPFALGELPLDTPDQDLSPAQQAGKRVFMNSCISCHDRARVKDEGVLWESYAVSFPRNQYSHKEPNKVDTESRATPYSAHDIAPVIDALNEVESRGEQLFQKNCAFCHGADGTGKNWIGSFLQPHPRDLTNVEFMAGMTEARLRNVIEEGLPGSTMSAWKGVLTAEQINAVIAYIKRAFPRLGQESAKQELREVQEVQAVDGVKARTGK